MRHARRSPHSARLVADGQGERRSIRSGDTATPWSILRTRSDVRGTGIGTRLTAALFPLASAMGKHVMIGGVDAENEASLRLHTRLGFQRVAHLHEVGHKFGRWLDLVLMQRFLDAPGAFRDR